MSIIPSLFPLSHAAAANPPFVDWLSFTVPTDEVEPLLLKLSELFQLFGSVSVDGLYRVSTRTGSGTCKVQESTGYYIISISGTILAAFRDFDLFQELLYEVSQVTHKITRLDVACDYSVKSADYVAELSRLAQAGVIALTRKAIKPTQFKEIISVDRYGDRTGTVYLGHRASSDVCARVYDKAHETFTRTGFELLPTLRIEFTFKGECFPTLRDVSLPSAIFYHHARQSLVTPPPDFEPWVPYGEGFKIDKRPPKSIYERLQGLLFNSPEIERFCHLCIETYGHEAPAAGAKLILRRIETSMRGMGGTPMQNSDEKS